MKKIISIFVCILFVFQLNANLIPFLSSGEATKIKSTIKTVTVFKSGAQVTREAKSDVYTGRSFLKFVGISPNIDKQSIQIKGEGDFTILSVLHQINYFEEPLKTEEVENLEQQRNEIQDKLDIENAIYKTFEEEESLILSNKMIGGQENGVLIEQLKATAVFYRSRLKEIKLEKLEIKKTTNRLLKEQQKIIAQLKELNARQGTYTSEVVLAIESKKQTSGDFKLSYLVKNAGWFANYDIRVKDIKNPVSLAYKANVFQTSGENWENVKLVLSTGNPSQTATKPNLFPWKLRFATPIYANHNGNLRDANTIQKYGGVQTISGMITDEYGEALIGANIMVSGTSVGTVTDFDGKYTLQLPANASTLIISYVGFEQLETRITSSNMNIVLSESAMSLESVVVTGLKKQRFSLRGKNKRKKKKDQKIRQASKPVIATPVENTITVEFKIEQKYTIQTDGKHYTVKIQEHNLPAYYEYYCAPKLDKDAFLTAQVTGWEELNLLNGEANLFFEGTYLGKSMLDVQNLSDTLDISLGRDKNIVVTRTKLKENSKRQFIGNKKTDTRAWDIEIRNKKKQAINILIEDQFPIATTEEIMVKHESFDQADLNEDTGILQWKFNLASNKTKKLHFRYSVKYPKKKELILE